MHYLKLSSGYKKKDMHLNFYDSSSLKEEAARLGFSACGIAQAQPIDLATKSRFLQWLKTKKNGNMHYLENHIEKRTDPQLLVEGAQSIIVTALNYFPKVQQSDEQPQISAYAYGEDYHSVVKNKLEILLQFMQNATGASGRCFCDTAPILERYWAQQSGIGFVGKNNLLIIPGKGSYHFLGIIITTALYTPDTPLKNQCGECNACLAHCPTNALENPFLLDANQCISYLTIEHRGEIAPQLASQFKNRLYGCDTCQQVCPWNRFATHTTTKEFCPSQELLHLDATKLEDLTQKQFNTFFKKSALKRTKYEGIMRNYEIWKKNQK